MLWSKNYETKANLSLADEKAYVKAKIEEGLPQLRISFVCFALQCYMRLLAF